MPIIPATSQASSSLSFSGIATSRTSRSRNGEIIPSSAEITIRPRTAASRPPVRPEQRDDPAAVAAGSPGRIGRVAQAASLGAVAAGSERRVEHLADAHDRVERHRLADVGGDVVEVAAVALGQDHLGDAGRVRGEHLLLEPADREHAALEGDLAGHPDSVLDGAAAQQATRARWSS